MSKTIMCQWGVPFLIAVVFVLMDWVKRWKLVVFPFADINCISLFVLILTQGIKQTDHFGFICRDQSESGPSQYMCYVFQCASESLVSQTKYINENDNFYSPHNILMPETSQPVLSDCTVYIRWMRWCWPWSRPSRQQQPYKATRPRSSYVKPAPCMTCTSSASVLKVSRVIISSTSH